jgi:dihydrofolate synthase/folylpolyglutamate synthase
MADLGERSDVPLVLIVGLLGTKDADGFLRNFVGLARALVAVPITGTMAARPADEVAQIGASVGLSTYAAPSIEAALALVKDIAFEQPPRILICGSLYLAGLVLAANDTPPV